MNEAKNKLEMSIWFVTNFIALCDGRYSLTDPNVKEGFYQNCISNLISIEVCVFKIGTDWYLFKIKVGKVSLIFYNFYCSLW